MSTCIEKVIKSKFYALEKEMRPIMDYLTEHQEDYPEYKGWVWLQGKLVYQPEIMFIGFNPGQGKDWNSSFHLPFTGERQLTFFEENNARYNKKKFDEERISTQWYEFSEPENNRFIRETIDILKKIVETIHPEQAVLYKQSKIPLWGAFPTSSEMFGDKLTFINLYPIAVEKEDIFNKLITKLKHKGLFEKAKNAWECREFFVHKTIELVSILQPKVVVCMGSQTYHDFTMDGHSTKADKNGIFRDPQKPRIIGFDRKGRWNLNAIANVIIEELASK